MATFIGTSGVDAFNGTDPSADTFKFTPANLSGTDTVSGGLGSVNDILEITAAGSISAAQLAGVSGIETIKMFAGSAIDLTANMGATARGNTIMVTGSAGSDSLFAGDLTDPAHR